MRRAFFSAALLAVLLSPFLLPAAEPSHDPRVTVHCFYGHSSSISSRDTALNGELFVVMVTENGKEAIFKIVFHHRLKFYKAIVNANLGEEATELKGHFVIDGTKIPFHMNVKDGILLGKLGTGLDKGSITVEDFDPKAEIDIRDKDGKVIIAADQILSYEWATHTLTLVPKLRGQLAEQLWKNRRLVSGVPFTVVVGGKVVYNGTFTSHLSSQGFSTPVILIDPVPLHSKLHEDQLRIQLGYPTTEFFKGEDPRADKRVEDALRATRKLAKTPSDHTEWIIASLREMQTIKAGMTREDLMKVFQVEGGLSTRFERRYAYRDCRYIKVDVKFETVGAPAADEFTNDPKDKITQISQPFLEWSIVD